MAITLKQWKRMVPGKVKIVVNKIEWEVVAKLKGEKHPTFLLREGTNQPEKFKFVPNATKDDPGIVDEGWNWALGLNLPNAEIVSLKD